MYVGDSNAEREEWRSACAGDVLPKANKRQRRSRGLKSIETETLLFSTSSLPEFRVWRQGSQG